MYVSLDHNAHTADGVKLYLLVLVTTPVAHLRHIVAAGLILLVALTYLSA